MNRAFSIAALLLLLGGCIASPVAPNNHGEGLALPADADRDRLPEQRALAARGYYYDRVGQLRPLPAGFARPVLDTSTQAAPATVAHMPKPVEPANAPTGIAPHATTCGLQVEAHRGVEPYPENGAEALAAAYAQGYSGAETDVQLTVDGTWVLHHDPLLGRTVEAGRYAGQSVGQVPASAFARMRLKDSRGQPSRYRAPTLSRALVAIGKAIGPGQHLNIEIKGRYACASLKALHAEVATRLDSSQIRYSATDLAALRCLRDAAPEVYLGYVHNPDPASLDARSGGRYGKARSLLQRVTGRDVQALGAGRVGEQIPLNADGVRQLRAQLGSNAGLHLDVRSWLKHPSLARAASGSGLARFSYSINGAAYHLEALATVTPGTLTGAIVDTTPARVCRAVQ